MKKWIQDTLLPMKKKEFAFIDSVSGKEVFYFRTASGLRVMATSEFSLFRVEAVDQ